ncbi:glycosyltransferase [Candidatus Woesearchaeota archaeon]|nr:glycosyltransferase [Candidatus Woesearchaeota archaeon]
MLKLSLIIPAYNEEQRIGKTLQNYLFHLQKYLPKEFEIIVVLNGCHDRSLEIVESFAKKHKEVRYVNIPRAIGKGGAVLHGFTMAKGKIIGFLDADAAFDMMAVQVMIERLLNGEVDCLIASKWKGIRFSSVNEPFLRKILSRGWNTLVKLLLHIPVQDTQAGAKFLRRDVFQSIGHDFICRGFDFDIELLLRVKQKGFTIKEEYVPNKHIPGSTFNLKYVPRMFKDLIKLWWVRKSL